MNPWILTHTGRRVSLVAPTVVDISLPDIAHALARIGRFTGHGRQFLSVAQHCVHVSELCPHSMSAWGLLHDASEAYIGDVSTPLKRVLRIYGSEVAPGVASVYDAMQRAFEWAISARFGVPIVDVKTWDIISAMTERRDNGPYGCDDEDWFGGNDRGLMPDARPIVPWTSERAEAMYLDRAADLGLS